MMHLLVVNLFELGQFLRILLWIFLPVFVISALITTYVHYRRKRKYQGHEDPVMGVFTKGDPMAMPAGSESISEPRPEEENGAYKGLLWLKNKYEQDRDQATARFVQLKEEHRLLREKYEDLLEHSRKKNTAPPAANVISVFPDSPDSSISDDTSGLPGSSAPLVTSGATPPPPTREDLIELASVRDQLAEKNLQLAFLQNQLDQRISNFHELEHQDREHIDRITELEARHAREQELLMERQATIDRLQEELQQEILRATEVRGKLESGGQLLLKLHGEIDQLLTRQVPESATEEAAHNPANSVNASDANASGDTPHIAAWVGSNELATV